MECSAPSEKAPERAWFFSKQGRRSGDYRGIAVISQETKAVCIERMDPLCNALLLRRNHFIEGREQMISGFATLRAAEASGAMELAAIPSIADICEYFAQGDRLALPSH